MEEEKEKEIERGYINKTGRYVNNKRKRKWAKSQSKKQETGKDRWKENEGFAQCTGQSVAHSFKKHCTTFHLACTAYWALASQTSLHIWSSVTPSGIAFKDFKRTVSGNMNFYMQADSSHLILCQIKLLLLLQRYTRETSKGCDCPQRPCFLVLFLQKKKCLGK